MSALKSNYNPSFKQTMKYLFPILFLAGPALLPAQAEIDELLPGRHLLSLQWISWEYFGHADISPAGEAGTYRIQGEQRSREHDTDYLTLEGTLRPQSARHLVFEGVIETSVHYLNGGAPCRREGTFHFKATGERQYWRLQEMENSCAEVTDYVDIYFGKTD